MFGARFDSAVRAFDAVNAQDPNVEIDEHGKAWPRELLDARRLSEWVLRLEPQASEPLQLAARCQHLGRWQIPRSEFPADRVGYLTWRKRLAQHHAREAENILRDLGYDADTLERVRRINLKQGLQRDDEVQTMEDALCLSFIEHELANFAEKHDAEKIASIVRKTWTKMSARAREAALELPLPERVGALVQRAIGS